MVSGGLKGDKHIESSVAAAGKNHPEDVRRKGGTGGDGVGNDGFTHKRGLGVLGDRTF